MSMIREVNELSSIQPNTIEKIKVSSAEILVHGTKEKPYYEIKYRDLSDGQIHEGYGSYNLDYVFEWLKECFEIIPEKDADRMSISEQINELRIAAVYKEHSLKKLLEKAADTIESLSVKLADMERLAEDCGRWIACKERLPEEKINPVTDDFYEYEVTFKQGDVIDIRHYKFGRGHWWNYGMLSDDCVIAWREHLEPYHEP